MKYAGGFLAAVIILLLTAWTVDSAAEGLSRITRFPKRLCALSVLLLSFLLFCTLGVLTAHKLYEECRDLLLSLSDGRGELIILTDTLICRARELESYFSLQSEGVLFEYISDYLPTFINKGTAYLLSLVGKQMAEIMRKAPSAIGTAIFFTVCTVWLSVDLDGVGRELLKLIPRDSATAASELFGRIRKAAAGFIWAHLVLFVIVLTEAYIGLSLLKLPYSLALSFLVAAVDILPLLGVSAVLLPASVITAIMGRYGLSLGILALFGVISATRQIAEPYLVGKRLGVHPFLSFVVSFGGLMLFGATGAVILPLLLSICLGARENK